MYVFKNIFLKFMVLSLCSMVLASCGDDEATEAGVAWLEQNPQVPANSGWKIKDVSSTGSGKFEIVVDMGSVDAVRKLNTLSAMDKGEVARLVCPFRGTEFWEIAGSKSTVTVILTNNAKNLVSAICRR